MNFDSYEVLLLIFGVAFLSASVLPHKLKKSILSLPMVYILAGFLLSYFWKGDPFIDPIASGVQLEKVTEMAVIISLMSAGLKIDRDLSLKGWNSTWRLLFITMPFCILGISILGWGWMNISLAAALLLGAAMAPTDPVMAADVQVDKPGEGEEDEVRFTLTSEAGLNDGLAFPFVYLAIFIATGQTELTDMGTWLTKYVLWKIIGGILVGYVVGSLIGKLFFKGLNNSRYRNGFVVVAITLATYGLAELVQTYGFIAVFVAGYFFRRSEKKHKYHQELHDFSNQLEHLFLAVLLIFFGMSIQQGLFNNIDILGVIIAIVFVFIIRPVGGLLAMLGRKIPIREKNYIAFLGIRGIGSFYYISYALNNGNFMEEHARRIWAVAGAIVLLSIIIHGITAPKFVKRITGEKD